MDDPPSSRGATAVTTIGGTAGLSVAPLPAVTDSPAPSAQPAPGKRCIGLRARSVVVAIVIVVATGWPQAGSGGTRSPHTRMAWGCADCHTSVGWKSVTFEHGRTGFQLDGRHATLTCRQCHRIEDFRGVDANCATCHPDHHQGALGRQCQDCHTSTDWRAEAFDHDRTAFPLWGAHGAVECARCHANDVTFQFADPPAACLDCHERDFSRAPTSVHLSAGPDCETCHVSDTWQGGHDPAWFEIRSGHHQAPCGRCHKQANDYSSYTCADCHGFRTTISEHAGVDRQDGRCLECHQGGFGDD